MKIYKDDIIEALETEPLTAGNWSSDDNCNTCAVGSIMRQVREVDEYAFSAACELATQERYGAYEQAPEGNYLSALSIVWEYLNENNRDGGNHRTVAESLREDIVDWAEENIPEDYMVEL